ncbi:MAG: hypothetical protein ACI8Z1_002644, partial [Candidatus Azotimanducaceae bacterium]
KDYLLVLRPKRQGSLTIPSIGAGNSRTEPISLRVQAQTQSQKQRMRQFVFFETQVDTKETYVQGQILYSVRLFYSDAIGGDFPLAPALVDAIIENIENEKRFESIVDGRRYYVLEKQYAIFPQKSGELLIPRERFVGTRGRGGMFSQRQRVTAMSESHTVNVKPVPAEFAGQYWIPAESLSIHESWAEAPPVFRVGEPVNRTLTIKAGGIPHTLLPVFQDVAIDGAKVYADPPDAQNRPAADGITALQQTTLGIVPTKSGSITLPEIRIPWWNTRSNREEIAVIPESTFEVMPAANQAFVAPIAMQTPQIQEGIDVTMTGVAKTWQWMSICLALLWILSTWQWIIARRKLRALQHQDAPDLHIQNLSPDEQSAYAKLKSACRVNDSQAAHRLLFLWGKARFPSVQSINDVLTQAPELKEPAQALEAFLFAGESASHWEGKKLIKTVTVLRSATSQKTKRTVLAEQLNPA